MTRFARAKGSKSSNVKTAEDSTPWEVMKEQLLKSKQENEESQKRKEAEEQRIENYNNFLKEHKKQKRKATWCEFPEAESSKKAKEDVKPTVQVEKDKTKPKKKHTKQENQVLPENNNQNEVIGTEEKSATQSDEPKVKKKKNKKKKASLQSEESADNTNTKTADKINDNKSAHTPLQSQKRTKAKKQFQGEPKRRKVINDKSFELIINGKEVELVRFDGFPIMKKDAERLQELKNNMIKKGIPKSEVQRNMKLERRRAEKALARMKREVCYNCRKGGHNLSDCPDLKSNIPGKEAAEGLCFKCGSTEHRQFECKVQRDKEFRFATCFICKESGHIARQCPDNPKGLYPNGGCCKLCGDVTHLKKDCHTVKEKKEETSIKLPTLSNDVEDIGFKPAVANTQQTEVKKPKKIKF